MQFDAAFSMDGSMANCSGTASTVSAIRRLEMACRTVMALRTRWGSMPRKGPLDDCIHGIFVVIPVDDAARQARGCYAFATLIIAQHVETDPRALLRGIPEQRLLAVAIHRQVLVRALCAQKSAESGNFQRPSGMQIAIALGQQSQVDLCALQRECVVVPF